jgi:hypothetical protein
MKMYILYRSHVVFYIFSRLVNINVWNTLISKIEDRNNYNNNIFCVRAAIKIIHGCSFVASL